jgi:hypothetical protein
MANAIGKAVRIPPQDPLRRQVRRQAIIFLHDVLPDRAFDAFIRRATGVPS